MLPPGTERGESELYGVLVGVGSEPGGEDGLDEGMDESRAGEGFVGVLSCDFLLAFVAVIVIAVAIIVIGRTACSGAVVGIVIVAIVRFTILATIFLLLKLKTRIVLDGVEDGI